VRMSMAQDFVVRDGKIGDRQTWVAELVTSS
jgi:hypothetical protein